MDPDQRQRFVMQRPLAGSERLEQGGTLRRRDLEGVFEQRLQSFQARRGQRQISHESGRGLE